MQLLKIHHAKQNGSRITFRICWCHPSFTYSRSRWNKKFVHMDMSVQFPPSSRVWSFEPSGKRFLWKNFKIVILITNKNFLNHYSPEINRLIMLHVTKKCWRPFYTDKRQTWEGDVRNFRWAGQSIPENGWAFLISLPKKKSFVSWNNWILELGTSNFHQPLSGNYQQQHRRGRFIFSLDSQRDR